jgi:hypothetical protein
VHYTVSSLTKWQHHHLSYKQPKTAPAKANVAKQQEFIEKYIEPTAKTPSDEPILMDSSNSNQSGL